MATGICSMGVGRAASGVGQAYTIITMETCSRVNGWAILRMVNYLG